MKAEGNVYRYPNGKGYVGRSPEFGGAQRIARRGDEVDDAVVEQLGLTDLKDHTNYDAIMAKAAEDEAFVSVRGDDGYVHMVKAGGESDG